MKVTIRKSNRKRKNKHGFLKRNRTKNGKAMLARRRQKGRKTLSAQTLKHSLNSREYSKLFLSHKSLVFGDLLFKYKNNSKSKLGIPVSKRYGSAVKRNLFKRRCRELFSKHFINDNILLVVRPLKKEISYKQLEKSFMKLNNYLNG